MTVFLIILAVLVVLTALLMSLSATLTVVYDKGWHTSVRVLFFEKDVVLSDILSFLMFPEKKAKEAKEKKSEKKKSEASVPEKSAQISAENEQASDALHIDVDKDENVKEKEPETEKKTKKPNYIVQLWDKEGIVGIMTLVTNVLQTASAAVTTFIKGFHIYSFYVKMIVGGSDAAQIAQKYGSFSSVYYPMKGMIVNGMRVDEYDDYIQADFIAPDSEFEMQFIGSISIGLILRMLLKAGFVFIKNYIKNN